MKTLAFSAVLAFIALGTSEAQATAAPVFDLVCRGESGESLHFRFDLGQKRWCVDQCQSVGPIDNLSDGTIKLVTFSDDDKNNWTIIIDRYTSAFVAIRRGWGNDPADKGECKAAPFSGFPNRKF